MQLVSIYPSGSLLEDKLHFSFYRVYFYTQGVSKFVVLDTKTAKEMALGLYQAELFEVATGRRKFSLADAEFKFYLIKKLNSHA